MTAPTSDDSADDGRHHRSPLSLYKRPSALKIAAQTPTLCVMSLRSSKSPLPQSCMICRRWIIAPTLIKFDSAPPHIFYGDAMRSLCSEPEFSHKIYVQLSLMVAAPNETAHTTVNSSPRMALAHRQRLTTVVLLEKHRPEAFVPRQCQYPSSANSWCPLIHAATTARHAYQP